MLKMRKTLEERIQMVEQKKALSKREKDAISAYRNYANLKEDFEITEDNIDEWALNEASCRYHFRPEILKEKLLNEATTLK